jgi:LCP family protein required for cell wall assembly
VYKVHEAIVATPAQKYNTLLFYIYGMSSIVSKSIMRKKPQAIDGFVSRSSGRPIGRTQESSLGRFDRKSTIDNVGESSHPINAGESTRGNRAVSRNEVDESLRGIDDEDDVKPKRRLFGLLPPKRTKKVKTQRRKITKRIIKIIVILALIAGAYVGIKAFIASTSIFKGNLLGLLQNKPLKTDANGRTNILIFGTSGSVDDQRHEGANLTDSILVASIDQKKNNAYLMSLPRDLWVDTGGACAAGYQAKINTVYECHSEGGTKEAAGAKALQKTASAVTGLTMQYYAHVNWEVLTEAVDAVGGIDVDVQGNGAVPYGVKPGSVLDRNFDGSCNNTCYLVKYEPGVHRMNGIRALAFSRARNANGGYGFAAGNFDREKNQQKVLTALKEKAVSAGTVTNIAKVTSLIEALGNNLRTNFDTSEIQTLMSLGKDIPSDSIKSLSFVDEADPLMTTGDVAGQSIVQPIAGLFDYSSIQTYIKKQVNANEITREDAQVAIFNGSNVEGYGQKQSDRLEKLGFTISAVDNAPVGTYGEVEIYDVTNKKKATRAKLKNVYDTAIEKGVSPINVTEDTDFVIILGPPTSAKN